MRNFHIKSIILGIGIGVVLTSVISMIYLAGTGPAGTLNKQEIIDQAKKYGMVDEAELLKNKVLQPDVNAVSSGGAQSVKISETPDEKKADTSQPVQTVVKNVQDEVKTAGQEIKLIINPGDSSETVSDKLFRAGLIKDKAAFLKELSEMGLTSEINTGEFKIITGTDTSKIIKILTGK